MSEENFKIESNYYKDVDWLWVLDPLDGTKDFIQGTQNYAMHLALNYKQKPLIGVVLIPEKNQLWISNGIKSWCESRDGTYLKTNPLQKTGRIRDMTVEFPEPGQNSRRQDLFPPSYIRNGAIYAMKREVLIEEFSRHGSDSLAFVMDENKSVNIDTVEDLTIADFKINNGECNNNPWEVKQNKIEFFPNLRKNVLETC